MGKIVKTVFKLALTVAVMLLFVLATVCDDAVIRKETEQNEAPRRKIVIGLSLDVNSAEARHVINGAKLAVDELNGSYGTQELLFVLSVADDCGDPDRFSENAAAFSESGVTVLICDGSYAEADAFGIITLSPFVSDFGRSLRSDCAGYGQAAAAFVEEHPDISRVTVLYDPSSTESIKTREEFENALGDCTVCTAASDIDSGLGKADAVFVTDAYFLTKLSEADSLLSDGAVIIYTDGAAERGTPKIPKTAHDQYRVTDFLPESENSRAKAFADRYAKEYGTDRIYGCAAAVYDGIYAFCGVISDEGVDRNTVDPKQLKLIAKSMHEQSFRFKGVSGCGEDMIWNGRCFVKKLTVTKVDQEVLL